MREEAPPDAPSRRMGLLGVVALGATAAAVALGGPGGADGAPRGQSLPVSPPGRCDVVAAPDGDDSRTGSAGDPVRSVRQVMNLLASGGVGCLRAGRWREDVKVTRDAITLRSFPGERATIAGRLWITRKAVGARITDLALDGRSPSGLPSPTVNGSRATFARNDVTNHRTGICFVLGSPEYGRPRGTTLSRNRIHGCGRLPSRNQDHGVYVARADDTRIVDNVIFDNADRGVQLYPNAARTTVSGNIIHGNGVGLIFSGAGGETSSRTTVTGNVVAASRIRADVESYYPPGTPRGRANVVRGNCIFGGRRGAIDGAAGGFSAFDNVESDPRLVAPSRGDFRLRPGSPCAAVAAASRAPAGPNGEPPTG